MMRCKIVRSRVLLMLMGLVCVCLHPYLRAQQKKVDQSSRASNSIAAHVDGQPIGTLRLQHELKRLQRTRTVRKAAQPALKAQLLAQEIDQLLILGYLEYIDQGARSAEIDLAVENLQKRIEQQDQQLNQYLRDQGLKRAELRQKIAWQIGWSRYLNRYLSDKNYQRYFVQNRREFDGTQLRVSHVLLKLSQQADDQSVERQQLAITQIRKRIVSGELSFAEAARKFSQSPTASKGGELGWIERHEPMPEEFSTAAFQLQQGAVSLPVRSPFGLHLIECREIKAGENKWEEVREPLRKAISKYLFQWAAQQQRQRVRVEFTGAWPYFQPETKMLVKILPDAEPCP